MRIKSVTQLMAIKPHPMAFTGDWEALMGRPELKGSMIIYGPSGCGKTRFSLTFAHYLTGFEKVAYVVAEEGFGLSVQEAVKEIGADKAGARLRLVEGATMPELYDWVSRSRSPRIVFIDSVQMSGLTQSDFLKFDNMTGKLFVYVSHEDPKDRRPLGALARKIEYHSFVKMRVEGYRAMAKSRYGGGKPFDIWPEEAAKYHGDK